MEAQAANGIVLTFGMNTKKSVAVEQNNMNTDMMMKEASCWSLRTKEMAAPATHISTTLYTLMPTYLESFSAGMLTCRVSQARKAPKTYVYIYKKHKKNRAIHFYIQQVFFYAQWRRRLHAVYVYSGIKTNLKIITTTRRLRTISDPL